jgi:threonylcarbamoyladenosine tRNA methylthiotransferase MtaB
MPGTVSAAVRKERSRQMLALAGESSRNFIEPFLGQTAEVLFEQESGGLWSGLTGNYIRVYVKSKEDLTNQLSRVVLVKAFRDGILGVLEIRR